MRNGRPVSSDSVRAVRRIWPPPSPSEPSSVTTMFEDGAKVATSALRTGRAADAAVRSPHGEHGQSIAGLAKKGRRLPGPGFPPWLTLLGAKKFRG